MGPRTVITLPISEALMTDPWLREGGRLRHEAMLVRAGEGRKPTAKKGESDMVERSGNAGPFIAISRALD
jgi:hypothetical protein